MKAAAAVTTYVCIKIHSGELISVDIKKVLDPLSAWNIAILIQAYIVTTYSQTATMAVIHYI